MPDVLAARVRSTRANRKAVAPGTLGKFSAAVVPHLAIGRVPSARARLEFTTSQLPGTSAAGPLECGSSIDESINGCYWSDTPSFLAHDQPHRKRVRDRAAQNRADERITVVNDRQADGVQAGYRRIKNSAAA
jgi:hypothetical protein